MGLFFGRNDYDDVGIDGGLHDTLEAEPHSKLYKILMWFSVAGLFITIAILVLGFTKALALPSGVVLLVCILLILCVGVLISLPWLRHLEKKEFKIPSIVFLAFNALTVVLLIVCAFLIWNMYKGYKDGGDIFQYTKSLTTFQVVFVITLQTTVATIIGTQYLRYQKKWLPLQVIIYIAYIFVDFYVTFAICCLRFQHGEDWLVLSNGVSFLTNTLVLTLLGIAVMYALFANSLIYRSMKKKFRRSLYRQNVSSAEQPKEPVPKATASAKERLEDLKKMLDDGLITEDEYNAKKEEILKDV